MVSPAQARAARKWNAEHREIMRRSVAKSSAKRFILKLADEDDLKEVQQWLAQRKFNERCSDILEFKNRNKGDFL